MMPAFTVIKTHTVKTTGVTAIDFTSIPQTYAHLYFRVCSRRATSSGSGVAFVFFNNDTNGANYYTRTLLSTGTSSAAQYVTSTAFAFEAGEPAEDGWAGSDFWIPQYASGGTLGFWPQVMGYTTRETDAATAYNYISAMKWMNAQAITSISIRPAVTMDWVIGTTVTMYGVSA